MPSANHLGRFIKECRQSLSYTSRKVEDLTRSRPGLVSISHSNLLAIEKGRHVPSFDKILTLAKIFNVPSHHFEAHLSRDMNAVIAAPAGADLTALASAGHEALLEGRYQTALESFTQILSRAESETEAGRIRHLALFADARLQAATCRKHLGLLRIAKDDYEEILAQNDLPRPILVKATFLLAEVHRDLGSLHLAAIHAEAALRLVDGEATVRARVLTTLGNILDDRGDRDGAVARYREALEIFEGLGDLRAAALVARNLGATLVGSSPAEAAGYIERGVAIARSGNDRRGLAYGLVNLARLRWGTGDLAAARESAREARAIAEAEGYPDVVFVSTFYLWKAASAENSTELSGVYAEKLRAIHRTIETRCAETEEWRSHIRDSRRRT